MTARVGQDEMPKSRHSTIPLSFTQGWLISYRMIALRMFSSSCDDSLLSLLGTPLVQDIPGFLLKSDPCKIHPDMNMQLAADHI